MQEIFVVAKLIISNNVIRKLEDKTGKSRWQNKKTIELSKDQLFSHLYVQAVVPVVGNTTKASRSGKSPGPDSIQSELLKYDDSFFQYLTAIGVGRIFSWVGAEVDFSTWWPQVAYFSTGGNSGEILFYQVETERKPFFYKKFNRKKSNFKIQGSFGPPLHPHPTPIQHSLRVLDWRLFSERNEGRHDYDSVRKRRWNRKLQWLQWNFFHATRNVFARIDWMIDLLFHMTQVINKSNTKSHRAMGKLLTTNRAISHARAYARGGLGLKKKPLSVIFYKNFISFARRLIVFAYFLLVNLST